MCVLFDKRWKEKVSNIIKKKLIENLYIIKNFLKLE